MSVVLRSSHKLSAQLCNFPPSHFVRYLKCRQNSRRSYHLASHRLQDNKKINEEVLAFINKLNIGEKAQPGELENEENVLRIDTSTLRKKMDLRSEVTSEKSTRTPLVKHLEDLIAIRGPIPIATFMRYALTHPEYGYYMKKDVFGTKGDFTTSPEISQMFGELIGLWCLSMWMRLDKPIDLQIVEVGPGRGTLMKEMFSTWYKHKEFLSSIHVNFVEVSPHLRKMQAQSLGIAYPDTGSPIDVNVDPLVKMTGDLDQAQEFKNNNDQKEVQKGKNQDEVVTLKTVQGVTVSWHDTINTIGDGPILYICQEFFDALPIHQYIYRDRKWREKIITIDHAEGPHWFKFELSAMETLAAVALEATYKSPAEGDSIETSPDTYLIGKEMATRIANDGGAALIIDYGHDRASSDSLRGIKEHKFVDVLMEPGEVDLSAFVDFAALKSAFHSPEMHPNNLENIKKLTSYGPITQGEFLVNLGIDARLAKLLRQCKNDKETDYLISSFRRLIDDDQMGKVYKVLAVSNLPNHQDYPDGFLDGTKIEKTSSIKVAR